MSRIRKYGSIPFGRSPHGSAPYGFGVGITPITIFGDPCTHWLTANPQYQGVQVTDGVPAVAAETARYWVNQVNKTDASRAYQGTSAARPVYISIGGGNFGLTFITDDFMTVPGNDTAGEFTYFFVLSSTQTDRNIIISHSVVDVAHGHIILNRTLDRALYYFGDSNFQYFVDFSAQDDGNPHLFETYIAGAGQNDIDNAELWADGVEISKDGSPTKTGGVASWDDLVIGRYKVVSDHYGDYTLSEFVVVAGSVTVRQRQQLELLWSKQYGYTLP